MCKLISMMLAALCAWPALALQQVPTGMVADGAVTTAKVADGALSADTTGRAKMANGFIATAKLADGALSADATGQAKMADGFLTADTAGRAKMASSYVDYTKVATGAVIQAANAIFSGVSTTTTPVPSDDTIPQITEGGEFMTLVFTPKASNSLLRIDVVVNMASTVATGLVGALYQDSTANALAVGWNFSATISTPCQVVITYWVSAGSTSARTYRVRGGATTAATVTFNGAAGARYFGGAMASSITVTEIKG